MARQCSRKDSESRSHPYQMQKSTARTRGNGEVHGRSDESLPCVERRPAPRCGLYIDGPASPWEIAPLPRAPFARRGPLRARWGFGLGITNICFVVAVQSAVDQRQGGRATSSLSLTRIVGRSLGAAVFGTMLNVGLANFTADGTDIVARMVQPGPHTGLMGAMETFTHSLRNVYLVHGLLVLVVLALIRSLPSGLNSPFDSTRWGPLMQVARGPPFQHRHQISAGTNEPRRAFLD
jgi:hypothetical protein